ncbi:MAG: phage/plasmid primase, P4 family [Proteobacteria bacterium]|nr:phage/plasmid primase, P4 family [Pseudomonadota bacterium]
MKLVPDRTYSRNEKHRSKFAGQKKPEGISEDNMALEFAEENRDDLRYVYMWRKWLRFDGAVWAKDSTLAVFDRVRGLCRRHGPARAATVAAVETLSRSDRRMAATTGQWDVESFWLNTPVEMIDLKSGNRYRHDPEKYCSKITAISAHGGCALWIKFLAEITAGDQELVDYLQRLSGYCLSGSTREHALFFLYGTGANGKSVFINTISGILGDYHRTAPIETFTQSKNDRHPTELAMLQGARLVTATETEQGRPWAESKVKALTGGDPIAARFMQKDFFEYIPIFKLLIAGNHKPRLTSVDEAIRRRMNLIPFSVTVPAEKRDEELPAKLKAEWCGILQWMVEGCLAWQEQGLNPPTVVRDATSEYLDTQDAFSQWVDECCEPVSYSFEKQSDLFKSWKKWAEERGLESGTLNDLKDKLSVKFAWKRQAGTGQRGFDGIRLIIKDYSEDDRYGN